MMEIDGSIFVLYRMSYRQVEGLPVCPTTVDLI